MIKNLMRKNKDFSFPMHLLFVVSHKNKHLKFQLGPRSSRKVMGLFLFISIIYLKSFLVSAQPAPIIDHTKQMYFWLIIRFLEH